MATSLPLDSLSKVLYGSKAFMFADQFGFGKEFVSSLEVFLLFVVYAYLPAWYRASFLTEAVLSVIQFAKELEW